MSSHKLSVRLHLSTLVFLVLALSSMPARAFDLNGFMPAPGEGAVALSYTAESYDQFWVGSNKVFNPGLGEVDTDSTTTWLTWGFTDNFAIIADLAYVDVTTTGSEGFADSGAQNLTLLGKYRFASMNRGRVRHSFIGAAGVRTPLSDYEGDAPVSLGDATTDSLFRLVYHLESGPFYISQQVGFDLRGSDAPNGFPLYLEFGYTTGKITWTGFYAKYIADGGTDIGDDGFTFPSNGDEYDRLGAKAYLRLKKNYGISLLAFETLNGRNSGDVTGFSGGLSVSL